MLKILLHIKEYVRLVKAGMLIFVLLGGLAGYAMGYTIGRPLDLDHLLFFLAGVLFISSGSFVLNQVQEVELDRLMPRTQNRPLVIGTITRKSAFIFSLLLMVYGLVLLYVASVMAFVMGALSIALYNGPYTLIWKRKSPFGAVPGAIPGAGPVVIGYAASSTEFFTSECLYMFLILFIWQMPHFWAIALRFSEDYAKGGFPVLPAALGVSTTLYHIGIYTFLYVLLAVASPLFVTAKWVYLLLVIPMAIMVLIQFIRFYSAHAQKHWLSFFMWVNFSILVFLFAPVIDKWGVIWMN
jgi:protoheme IX farnesyltransferase